MTDEADDEVVSDEEEVVHLGLKVSRRLKAEIERRAEQDGRTVSGWCRRVLEEGIARLARGGGEEEGKG